MIKLIASDLDGTLLPYGDEALPEEIFTEIRRLMGKGILFCPASGRQYPSLRKLFAPIADEVYFITENGAINFAPGNPGEIVGVTKMDYGLSMELIHEILTHDGLEITVSCIHSQYVLPGKNQELMDWLDDVGNRYVLVSSPEEIPDEIVKISIYKKDAALHAAPLFQEKWSRHFAVAIAGNPWLDFTLANKGKGILQICEATGISPQEVMAFGDNFNDIEMLQTVGHPYLMAGAAPELLPLVKTHCTSVLEILKTL